MVGEGYVLAVNALLLSLASLGSTFQCCARFSMRVGGQRNSLSIAPKLAAYFSLEVTANFRNNIRNIHTELYLGSRKFSS